MPHFFIILFKINVVLLLFGATYYLILRKLTFYNMNRMFLVFGILFATAYPFIDLTDFYHQQNTTAIAFVPHLNDQVTAIVPNHFITVNWQIISILFYIGVALMAFRLILQFISLYNIHKKSKPGKVENHQVRILNEEVSPFSFWQTVYINPNLHQPQELQTILAHEHIHVKQWHSLDIILAELSVVFYWFNPGIWLIKRAVKENLEFITDQKILNKGVDRKVYQYSLLGVGNLTPAAEIVNNFNLSALKKRIKMMNSKRSSKIKLISYLVALPLLLLVTLAFTIAKKDIKTSLKAVENIFVPVASSPDSAIIKPIAKVKSKVRKKINEISKLDSIKYTFTTVFVRTDTSDKNINSIIENLDLNVIDVVGKLKGKVNGVFVVKDTSHVIKDYITRLNINSDFEPSNSIKSDGKEIIVKGYAIGKKVDSNKLNNINYYVNGKAINADDLRQIEVNTIKSIQVKKDGSNKGEIKIIEKKIIN